MKIIDDIGVKLCRTQGEVFSESAAKAACSSAIFIRRFMNSSFALRLDEGGILTEIFDKNIVFEELEYEFGPSDYGKEKYSIEELYWIGYIYRYWCYTREKTSKQVYKIIKPKELRSLYFPYHSLDPVQAIDRILEAKDMGEDDYTKRGVEILRKIIEAKPLNNKTATNLFDTGDRRLESVFKKNGGGAP